MSWGRRFFDIEKVSCTLIRYISIYLKRVIKGFIQRFADLYTTWGSSGIAK